MLVTLPLSTLLSQVLVAFTIEFDNEAERQMPHRTSNHGSTNHGAAVHTPWLVSMAMWTNCMQFVGAQGVGAGELEKLARTKTNLNGMVRWGYVTVGPDRVIRATPAGRKAQEVWRPLFGLIERRWQARFGKDEIERLRESLREAMRQVNLELPDCLPILGYGLFSRGAFRERRRPEDIEDNGLPLPALLSRVLLAFAIEFEHESEVSLAISANVLRVLDQKGVRVRDVPLLAGVSKEAISMALGFLQKKLIVVQEPDQSGRGQTARLTAKGRGAQDAYRHLLGIIEVRWQERIGKGVIGKLRESLERLAGEPTGLEPYPDGWRASVRKPNTLPHYPMVLHRGGFPDGS